MDENKEKNDLSKPDNESMVEEKKEEKSPFGEGVKIALHIIYNEKLNQYGVVAAPGFLDVPDRAYYALKCAEKNLDEFYFKKRAFATEVMKGVQNFQNRMNFRGFLNKRFK